MLGSHERARERVRDAVPRRPRQLLTARNRDHRCGRRRWWLPPSPRSPFFLAAFISIIAFPDEIAPRPQQFHMTRLRQAVTIDVTAEFTKWNLIQTRRQPLQPRYVIEGTTRPILQAILGLLNSPQRIPPNFGAMGKTEPFI